MQQSNRKQKIEAQKQAIADANASKEDILVPAPQEIITLIAVDIETAEKMADLYTEE